jgi:hypothetical protein
MADEPSLSIDAGPLRQLGLSDGLCAWVEGHRYPGKWTVRVGNRILLTLGAFMLGFAVVVATRLGSDRAMAFVRTEVVDGPFHYETPEPWSLLPLLFCVAFFSSYLNFKSNAKNPKEMRDYDLLANLSAAAAYPGLVGRLSRPYFRWIFRRLVGGTPQAELSQLRVALRNAYLKPGLVLGLLGLLLATNDLFTFQLATLDGVMVRKSMLSRPLFYSWDDLTKVHVGAWVFPRDGLSVKYVAEFEDGTESSLLGRTATEEDVALATTVDNRLRMRAIPKEVIRFSFGRHSGELQMQPDCPEQVRRVYREDLASPLEALVCVPH